MGIFAGDLADQAVAVALAVGIGAVEEVAAAFDRQAQGGAAGLVVGVAPAAHAPKAMADLADLEFGFAKLTLLHGFSASSLHRPPFADGPDEAL